KLGPIFTPPVVSTWPRPLATLVMPSAVGGANWPGGALDPETNFMYIYSLTSPTALGLIATDPSTSDFGYRSGRAHDPNVAASAGGATEGEAGLTVRNLPIVKPPYARITAIDLNKGEIAWQIPHGETPDNIRNHPSLKGLTIPRTGRQGRIGVLTTKGL